MSVYEWGPCPVCHDYLHLSNTDEFGPVTIDDLECEACGWQATVVLELREGGANLTVTVDPAP